MARSPCARTLLISVVIALVAASHPTAVRPNPGHEPAVSISSASPSQREDAEWALSRFADAGLVLPRLTIVFHEEYESCGMREGVLRMRGSEAVIHECERDRARSRRSLMHELTHAWDRVAGGISADRRHAFLEARGLATWSGVHVPWNERGEEQAAEIVTWGLMLRPAPIPTSVADRGEHDQASLRRAFQILTGGPPLFSTERQVGSHMSSGHAGVELDTVPAPGPTRLQATLANELVVELDRPDPRRNGSTSPVWRLARVPPATLRVASRDDVSDGMPP